MSRSTSDRRQGTTRNAVAAATAQQLGDRKPEAWPDVEQGHFHRGLWMADHGVVGVGHQRLDAERIGAQQQGRR